MTPVEIAYFKHFLFDKSIERSYVSYYRKYHIKGSPRGDKDGNPESIEQFFLQTSVEDVIMKAFTFYPTNLASRSNFTYDYWKEIDDKWQEYMKQNESNWTNDSWPMLRKTFAILRQNWDLPQYWKRENLESTAEVYDRMHIDLPLPDVVWEHGYVPKKNEGEVKTEVVEIPDVDFEEDDLDIDFVEFDQSSRRTVYSLQKGIMSVNTRSHSWRITINRTDTKEIRRKDVTHVMIGKTRDGREDIMMFCRNTKGIPFVYNADNYLNVNSRQFVGNLRRMIGITDDLTYLRIEKIAEKMDSITYKLTKQ